MLEINKLFKQLRQTLMTVMVIGLAWLISLPTALVQASPSINYLGTEHNLIAANSKSSYDPLNAGLDQGGFDEIESGKRAAEVIPKDLGNSNKDVGERINRAVNELGNDQYQRVFGGLDKDEDSIKKSEAELKVESKKGDR